MRQFYTVVLERMRDYAGGFDTEPYETGWAGEAMFFVRVHRIQGAHARLDARAQVSVDGIEWLDEGTALPPIDREGSCFIRVSHFGGWLRLHCEFGGTDASVRVTVHLVLKE